MTRWDRSFYRQGYEGFEAESSFPTRDRLDAYRSLLLSRTAPIVDFIKKQLGPGPFDLIEYGSGNGRLPIALAADNVLRRGVGVEIAASRVAFANAWLQDRRLADRIQFICGDVLLAPSSRRDEEQYDVAACITGAFGYFYAVDEDAPRRVLERLFNSLRPGGHILLELHQLVDDRRHMIALSEGRLRTWHELPADDPFRFYLDDFEFWSDVNVIRHRKIFVRRDGFIDDGREEILKYYALDEVRAFLLESGYIDVVAFGGFSGDAYQEGQSKALVLFATKPRPRP